MKRRYSMLALSLVLCLFLGALSGWGQTPPSQAPKQASSPAEQATLPTNDQPPMVLDAGAHLDPMKIAQLKWYLSNTSTQFPVGSQPYGLCFDGANIWSANFGDNTVSKIQANDGTVLGTFKVGNQPLGVTFDGANIWVSNSADGTVSKLRAQDGVNLGTFTAGRGVSWMAFDGQNIWAASSVGTVTKFRASDGKNLGTFTVAFGAFGVAFDGQNTG
jgi:DNA-binding beta-propeller fold protein YncE